MGTHQSNRGISLAQILSVGFRPLPQTPPKSRMTKQESAALNMAKFIRAQSLLLLEKLDVLNLDDEAADCERMHEQAEALYQKLSARFGIQDGE